MKSVWFTHPSHSHWLALHNLLQQQENHESRPVVHEALAVDDTRQLLRRANLFVFCVCGGGVWEDEENASKCMRLSPSMTHASF